MSGAAWPQQAAQAGTQAGMAPPLGCIPNTTSDRAFALGAQATTARGFPLGESSAQLVPGAWRPACCAHMAPYASVLS